MQKFGPGVFSALWHGGVYRRMFLAGVPVAGPAATGGVAGKAMIA